MSQKFGKYGEYYVQEIAPGISRGAMEEARKQLRVRADGDNVRGFMLAFSANHGRTLGFSFYLEEPSFALSLHAKSLWNSDFSISEPTLYQPYGEREGDEAAAAFFATAATNMEVSQASLVRHIGDRRSDWRFEGYIDGVPSSEPDNGRTWNPLFWYRVKSAVDSKAIPTSNLPTNVRALLFGALRAHAREGVVVLRR